MRILSLQAVDWISSRLAPLSLPRKIAFPDSGDRRAVYALFDGSIEAPLPEGTLRFGSITELRNHIEQSA